MMLRSLCMSQIVRKSYPVVCFLSKINTRRLTLLKYADQTARFARKGQYHEVHLNLMKLSFEFVVFFYMHKEESIILVFVFYTAF